MQELLCLLLGIGLPGRRIQSQELGRKLDLLGNRLPGLLERRFQLWIEGFRGRSESEGTRRGPKRGGGGAEEWSR